MKKKTNKKLINPKPRTRRIAKDNGRKKEELLGLLLILFGILVAISIFTYNPQENPDNVRVGQTTNGLGIVGVYISYYLIRGSIGYSSVIFPLLIILWGFNRLVGRETKRLIHWTVFTVLFSFYVSVSGALKDIIAAGGTRTDHLFSGLIGGLGAELLYNIFGQYGSIVVLIGIILTTVILSTEITFAEVFGFALSYLQRLFYKLQRVWQRIPWDFSWLHKQRKRTLRIARGDQSTGQKQLHPPVMESDRLSESQSFLEEPEPVQEPFDITQPAMSEEEPQSEMAAQPVPIAQESRTYVPPPLDLLQRPPVGLEQVNEATLRMNAQLLEEKLSDFGITAQVVEIHPGPVITRYELELAPGIKVSRVTSLSDDLAMAMRAKRIRIVAPIPGKAAIGIEIPNPSPEIVYLREILESEDFQKSESPLTIGLGKTASGKPFVTDLSTMPHLLVAGSTGSGKSVCLNTIITSILYKAHPSEVQFALIDPKRLELSTYGHLHRYHLTFVHGAKEKVATTPRAAIAVLRSLEQEMEKRYEILAGAGVRNIQEYNQRVKDGQIKSWDDEPIRPLNYLVIIVDELADLMLTSTAAREVEEPIARLTQMSRAVGIHLILATQRPSVDVITGIIKANFPARIAFQVASKVDSRTILDMNGAEKLLGRGDMLFLPPASPEPIRLHNAFISLNEIESVIKYIRTQPPVEKQLLPEFTEEEGARRDGSGVSSRDPLFQQALKLVVRTQQGSVSLLQRRLKVGYARAARIIDELEDAGVVGPFEGSKAREVLISPEELEAMSSDDLDEF